MSKAISYHSLLAVFVLLVFNIGTASAQTTEFTYQGKLTSGGTPANTNHDFDFKLYDALTGATPIGTLQRLNVSVTNGIFTVQLDFGAEGFRSSPRFLEIAVKPAGSPDPFTTLTPRHPVTSAPFAIRSLSSANSDQLGGIDPGGFILNTNTPQNAGFNISGNGRVGGALTVAGLALGHLTSQ